MTVSLFTDWNAPVSVPRDVRKIALRYPGAEPLEVHVTTFAHIDRVVTLGERVEPCPELLMRLEEFGRVEVDVPRHDLPVERTGPLDGSNPTRPDEEASHG